MYENCWCNCPIKNNSKNNSKKYIGFIITIHFCWSLIFYHHIIFEYHIFKIRFSLLFYFSHAVESVILPLSKYFISILANNFTFSMFLIIYPLAFINKSFILRKYTRSISFSIHPLTFIIRTIIPSALPISFSFSLRIHPSLIITLIQEIYLLFVVLLIKSNWNTLRCITRKIQII